MRLFWSAAAAAATVALGACSGGSDNGPGTDAGSRQTIRAESACSQEGLDAPKRQTVVLIDAKAIQKTRDATEFAARNTGFRDLILSIADPVKALNAGLAVARERIVIAVVPSDGTTADVAFTGCIPGLSADEMAAAKAHQSAVASAFSSGVSGQLDKEVEAFRTQLIGGLVAAAARADGSPSSQSGPIATSHYLQGVRSSRSLWDAKGLVPRLILVSDLSTLDLPAGSGPTSRLADGISAGRSASGDLGMAEVHVVLPVERPLPDQSFLRGYFLAQNAVLASTSVGRVTGSPLPPRRLWYFAGEAAYPSGAVPLDVRLGDDGGGKLTASWVTVLSDPRFAIPLTGQIACATATNCKISSDSNGFAQAWTGASSNAPKFSAELPFGGMRNAVLNIAGERLTGRVSDDAVTVGKNPNQNWIEIKASTKQL